MYFPFPDNDTPLRILVVDDVEFDRVMITERLKEVVPPSSTLVAAASGIEALEIFKNHETEFDCVLLDMNLPDIHGIELTRQLQPIRPDVGIVIITAEADMEKALLCLQAGAQDFLIKGEYSNVGLYRTIRYAIERHRHRVETVRLERTLHHKQELIAMQKEFIHLVSHEFRTPITIISGAMQLLGLKAPDLKEGEGAAQFTKVHDALNRLIGLLDNVQRLSQMEEGKLQFQPESFDMQQLLQHVCLDYPGRLLQVGDKQSMHYYGDRVLVMYALVNVISNAIKYSPPDSIVEVDVAMEPRGISLLITDTGAGMSAEVMTRVGERFYRGIATSHLEGTGLGLYLARRFMEYHGGTLMICSEEGAGTKVRLFFPHQASMPVAV